MDLSRKITVNTLTQVIGRVGVILVSLLTTAILTRYLGQAGYGAFGVINTAVIILFSFADWGTNLTAVRELSKSPEKSGLFLGNCLVLRGLMSLLGITALWLLAFLNPALISLKKQILIASLIILFFSLRTSAQIIFHSKLKLHWAALVEFLAALIFLGFLLVLKGDLSLTLIIWLLVASSGLSALAALLIVFRMVKVDFHLDFSLWRHLIKESLPMGALMAVFSIYNRVDVFILQSLKDEAATGLYLLAYKVHDNLVMGAAYLMNAFFPIISRFPLAAPKEIDLKTVLQKAFDLLLVMAFLMMVVIFLLAPLIIDLLGGEEFGPSVTVLRILIFATGVAYLNHLTGYSLAALGKQRVHLKFGILVLIVNIIFNLVLIPRYSFLGAASVTVLSEALIFILSFFYLRKVIKIRLDLNSFPKTLWQLIINKGKIF